MGAPVTVSAPWNAPCDRTSSAAMLRVPPPPRCQWLLGSFCVVPAGALPVPVSDKAFVGQLNKFSPVKAGFTVLRHDAPRYSAMQKLRIVTVGDFGWEIAHAAVTRRPPISDYTMVPRTGSYTYDIGVWELSIVQRPFSIALCQNPIRNS
jgi:hypothetical protein